MIPWLTLSSNRLNIDPTKWWRTDSPEGKHWSWLCHLRHSRENSKRLEHSWWPLPRPELKNWMWVQWVTWPTCRPMTPRAPPRIARTTCRSNSHLLFSRSSCRTSSQWIEDLNSTSAWRRTATLGLTAICRVEKALPQVLCTKVSSNRARWSATSRIYSLETTTRSIWTRVKCFHQIRCSPNWSLQTTRTSSTTHCRTICGVNWAVRSRSCLVETRVLRASKAA